MVLKVTTPREGLRTVARGTEMLGLSVGNAGDHSYIVVGWQTRDLVEVLDENTSVRLEWPRAVWPSGKYFSVRVGSGWPAVFQERAISPTEENE